MGDSANWCLIESDPGVFTELMNGFGVEGIECEEIYDIENTNSIEDALGLIFLFKWERKVEISGKLVEDDRLKKIFFAEQVIRNACATQAIINILLNIPEPNICLGETLSEFKHFVSDFDSKMKGNALTNCDKMRSVHNSFSYPQMFELDDKKRSKSQDVYHFVGYMPIDTIVYEFDGLKSAPIDHGPVPVGSIWLDIIKPIIYNRMKACVDGRFNLMAIVPSRLKMYKSRLAEVLSSSTPSEELIDELKNKIEMEQRKFASQRSENLRRRHNYLPFIIELLKILAENGRLIDSVKKAKQKAEEKADRKITSA